MAKLDGSIGREVKCAFNFKSAAQNLNLRPFDFGNKPVPKRNLRHRRGFTSLRFFAVGFAAFGSSDRHPGLADPENAFLGAVKSSFHRFDRAPDEVANIYSDARE